MSTEVLERPKTKEKVKQLPQIEVEVIEKVRLQNISWETYEKLIEEQTDNSALHLTYNNGDLEIMVESFKHGIYSRYLEYLVIEIADFFEIDFVPAGSATFRKKKKAKGFEGDGSFYFKNAESIRGKDKIDLEIDPSPELVIEVDITHGSLEKFPIFAGLGVEEVWRFDGEEVIFYRLEDEDYKQIRKSVCLEGTTSETVTKLLFAAQKMKRVDWIKLIHKRLKKIRKGK